MTVTDSFCDAIFNSSSPFFFYHFEVNGNRQSAHTTGLCNDKQNSFFLLNLATAEPLATSKRL